MLDPAEVELFKRIEARLDDMNAAISTVRDRVHDVRESVIRIEAQETAAKVTKLEERVRALEEWKSKVTGQIALIIIPVAAFIGALAKWIFDLNLPGR